MFSRSGNPLLIFLQSYHVWVISKIQVNFRFKTYSEVLVNVSYRFLKFLDYSCFWGHVMSRHATSSHVMSRHFTSFHVMPRHVMSRHVTSSHVMSRPVTSCHVLSRPVTSCHVGCPEGCRYHTASAVYNLVHYCKIV